MSHYHHLFTRAATGAAVIAVAFLVVWLDPMRGTPASAVDIWFFDIGQGDAALIQTGSTQILIDGGPTGKLVEKIGRVVPFWDQYIEYTFMSHPHADHYVGFLPLAEHYDLGEVYVAPQEYASQTYQVFVDTHEERVLMAGDELELASNITARILSPHHEDLRSYEDPNDGSVIMLLDMYGTKILFTGDAGIEQEKEILAELGDIDVLKVGHHGSYTSTSRELLEVTQPEEAVMSLGFENEYNHPHAVILNRLQEFGARIWRTDQDGDVRVRITPEKYTIHNFWL